MNLIPGWSEWGKKLFQSWQMIKKHSYRGDRNNREGLSLLALSFCIGYTDLTDTMKTLLERISFMQPSGPHWIVLRIASALIKIIAVLLLLVNLGLGLLVVIAVSQQATAINPLPGMVIPPFSLGLVAVVGIVGSIFLYAFSDLILLFIAIEKNTRVRNY
jgi:hypothetical protein